MLGLGWPLQSWEGSHGEEWCSLSARLRNESLAHAVRPTDGTHLRRAHQPSGGMSPTSQQEARVRWENTLRAGQLYAKCVKVHAKMCKEKGTCETVVNGIVETSKAYQPGDFMAVNPAGERYIIDAHIFRKRYLIDAPEPAQMAELDPEGFQLFTACGRCWAKQLTQAECEESFPENSFMASWGEAMLVEPGDWLAAPAPQGGEVYRIENQTFSQTYAPVQLPPLY